MFKYASPIKTGRQVPAVRGTLSIVVNRASDQSSDLFRNSVTWIQGLNRSTDKCY